MKERGSPPTSRIETPKSEPLTAPKIPKKESPAESIINASGHFFRPIENIPYAGIPNTTLHYYEEVGEDKKTLNVKIIEIGLNDPTRQNEPIPLRIDHGCPCMELQLAGHDCAQQRELAMDAMKTIGRGMMVLVNSEASAANGYGTLLAMSHQKAYQEAFLAGEQPPGMADYFLQLGIKDFDIRKHPEIAALIARRLETVSYDEKQNPIILLGSSPAKIDSLQNGRKIQIADTAQVIDADFEDRSKEELGYGTGAEVTKSGVYLEIKTQEGETRFVLLTDIFSHYKDLIFTPRQEAQEEKVVYSAGDKGQHGSSD